MRESCNNGMQSALSRGSTGGIRLCDIISGTEMFHVESQRDGVALDIDCDR